LLGFIYYSFISLARKLFQHATTAEFGLCSEVNDQGLIDWDFSLGILTGGRILPHPTLPERQSNTAIVCHMVSYFRRGKLAEA
jgi:hypothetical protein